MSRAPSPWANAKHAHILRQLSKRLLHAGIDQGPLEARFMLSAVLNKQSGDWIDPDLCLDRAQADQLEAMCIRREAREPLSHILGNWGFWSLELQVSADVLTPRPETEILVETALKILPSRAPRILDLGTGSGAIVLALLSARADAEAVAVDISPPALEIAANNGRALGVESRVQWLEGSWSAALSYGPFDLVVSNPPYIASAVIAQLEPEVARFEPRLALDGGADGLQPYRVLLPLMGQYLKPGGAFVFEIGADQGNVIMDMAKGVTNLRNIMLKQDLAGRDRLISGGL